MTVDGVEMEIKPGVYKGKVVLTVIKTDRQVSSNPATDTARQ